MLKPIPPIIPNKEILMIAIGIDISKSKSKVAVLNSDSNVRAKLFDVHHNRQELDALVAYIKETGEQPLIVKELTRHYHYPVLKALQDVTLQVYLFCSKRNRKT